MFKTDKADFNQKKKTNSNIIHILWVAVKNARGDKTARVHKNAQK